MKRGIDTFWVSVTELGPWAVYGERWLNVRTGELVDQVPDEVEGVA